MTDPDRTQSAARRFEAAIGRLLLVVTYVAVALLSIGVLLMVATGISPLDGGPPLDIASLGSDLVNLQPEGFLWLGLIAVIATPVSRVVAAGIGFGRSRDWALVAVSISILVVITVGIVTALVAES